MQTATTINAKWAKHGETTTATATVQHAASITTERKKVTKQHQCKVVAQKTEGVGDTRARRTEMTPT